jgi:hypothetical protein
MTFKNFPKQAGVSLKIYPGIQQIDDSNLRWNISHTNLGLAQFSSIHPSKCCGSTLKEVKAFPSKCF